MHGFVQPDNAYQIQHELVESHLANVKVPVTESQQDNATITLDKKRQLSHLFDMVEEGLVDIEANVDKTPTQALQRHVEKLLQTVVEGEQKKITLLTWELIELEPEQREVHWIKQHGKDKDILALVRRCR